MENNSLAQHCFYSLEKPSEDLSTSLQTLGIQWVQQVPKQQAYVTVEDESLKLKMPSGLSLSIDFSDSKYQRTFSPSKELLCRACGWHKGLRHLWDLTAGLGVDSMMLAQAGFNVRAFERNPYLVLLLQQALHQLKAKVSPVFDRGGSLSFEMGESELSLVTPKEIPEVIYYDPMYPAKRKTALPSKEMQVLRELHGTSGESSELLAKAVKVGARRVVVKRPHRAPPVISKPAGELVGKLVRYDIY